MKEFKYDIVRLIHEVRERPCLWNKELEVYKDRLERRKAWEEIFCLLDDRYESMSREDQRLAGEHVLGKWTNIRDTFVKSLKVKMGKPRRKYIFYDHLQFLVKGGQGQEAQNGEPSQYVEEVSYMKEEQSSEEDFPRKRTKRSERSDDSYSPKSELATKRRSKKKDLQELETDKTKDYEVNTDINFVEVGEVSNAITDHRLMNEDEAFFASLLPTVVKYSEDERLEFRIEVLGVMKKIKENRKWCVDDP